MKQMERYVVYCYTNIINNKKYIGQSKDIQRRCHPSNYKGSIKFYNAIQKYGWDSFTQEILANDLTRDEANFLEEQYIQYFNTVEDGYNIKSGGQNNYYSEDSKKKMSDSCKTKRKIICVETQKIFDSAMEIERELFYKNTNIIACCKNKNVTAYGYHWQYLEDFLNQKQPKKDARMRAVYCLEKDETFISAAEASRQTGVPRPNITKCCQGQLKTAGGYHWYYATEC